MFSLEGTMEEHFVDVRHPDGRYVERVRVWLDRATDRYHLPEASAARLGSPGDGGDYLLLGNSVTAKPVFVGRNGDTVRVWTVSAHQLATRPASPVVTTFA